MDRINTATKAVDLYGAGKHGWKNSNVTLGTPPTDFNAEWTNGVQEELLNMIEAVGIVPAIATLTQLRQAVKRLAAANLRTITVVGPTALTADDAGVVLIDATANNVTVTLPAANAVAAVPIEFNFVRVDTSANTVTVNRAGADTFVGGATSFTLANQKQLRAIRSDAVSKWVTVSSGENQSLGTAGYREIGGGLILQWGSTAVLSASADVVTTLPITFPNAFHVVISTQGYTVGSGVVTYAAHQPTSTSQFTSRASVTGNGFFYLAIGR